MTRERDNMDQQNYYELKHRVDAIESSIEQMQQRVQEDHTNLRCAIKDLADSQKDLAKSFQQQTLSMVKLETSLDTIAKSLKWGIPILFGVITSIVGAVYSYNQILDEKIAKHTPVTISSPIQ